MTGGALDLEDRLSVKTSSDPAAPPTTGGDAPEFVTPMKKAQEDEDDWEELSPSMSSTSASEFELESRINTRRSNDRLTSIARTAVLATKEQFWDSNESGIVAAQTAVDRWEDAYVWVRNAVVASSRSAAGIYDASKAGVRGLDQGLLVPVRDYVLLPTFGFAEHVVSETSSFLQSSEAERIRSIAAEGSSEFVSRAVPFGLGDSVVLPAVRLGSETVQTAWDVARYPVPSRRRVRDTVDFLLNGSKENLSFCSREIFWYIRRADANIARTLRRTQWVVLGSGPYETLDSAGRQDVMNHVCERYLSIGKSGGDSNDDDTINYTTIMVAKYEFMANVRACNRTLYRDLVETGLLKERGGDSTSDDEWLSERPLYRNRSTDLFLLGEESQDDEGSNTAFALWFRLPFENGERPKNDVPWVRFDEKEGALLEDKYRSTLKQSNDIKKHSTAIATPNMTGEQQNQDPQPAKNDTWELPKYATNAKWYDPDFYWDVLLEQKRHAVTFVRCCPRCRKQQHEGEKAAIAQKLSEICDECRKSQQEQEENKDSEEDDDGSKRDQEQDLEGYNVGSTEQQELYSEKEDIASNHLSWGGERLLALPPPLLGLFRPTMWRYYSPDEIRRAVWFLDTPRNGPQPYGEDAQALLEDAYQFLKWKIFFKRRGDIGNADDSSEDSEKGTNTGNENVLLTVQVPSPESSEQQLVQFSSLDMATAIGKGFGGAISLFKRRVYRGAYNYVSREEDEIILKGEEDVIPSPIDEESRWPTSTEEALAKLSLAISSVDSAGCKESEEQSLNLDYNEGFKDLEAKQELEEREDVSLDKNDSQSSTHSEKETRDDGPSLAFQMEPTHNNSTNNNDDSLEVEHLILVVHGIGEMMQALDIFGLKKVPTIAECCGYLRDNHAEVSDSRSNRTTQTNTLGRVEYLPVEWHEAFSIQSTRRPLAESFVSGTNRRSNKVGVNDISLRTIPTLRSFANDTLMDILYFMSPVHHDVIIDIVAFELNFIVKRFRKLTGFNGDISIIGHSIGSVIAWDILDHQNSDQTSPQSPIAKKHSAMAKADDSYRYPQLNFQVDAVYMLGSPIPVFLMIRNQENPLSNTFTLNGCSRVFNIFHPYDPVSYRIEPLLNSRNAEIEPDIMLHWNGGFRFQYQTKRIWKKIVDQTLRAEENVIHSLESGIEALGLVDSTFNKNASCDNENGRIEASHRLLTGALNAGRRIDYMLQEKEIDRANEYVAALAAHSCYWLEKDLSLFIANEIRLAKETKHVSK